MQYRNIAAPPLLTNLTFYPAKAKLLPTKTYAFRG